MIVHSLSEQQLLSSLSFLFSQNSHLKSQFEGLLRDMVRALVAVIEAKDPYTHGHSWRVSEYALLLGRGAGLLEAELVQLELGALLHDVGKIGVPDAILVKPGKLSEEEYQMMKKHPLISAEIISHIEWLKEVVPIVKHHQERIDGLGYPEGLRGEKIPKLARMVYVADSFDAMTSDRPYRKGMSSQEAFMELEKNQGRQFDPDFVKIFIREYKKGRQSSYLSAFFPHIPERKREVLLHK